MASKKSNDTESVIKFRGYREMTVSERNRICELSRDIRPSSVHDHDLLDEIFAPDPITGNPSSDLYVRRTADPEVRDFIDRQINAFRLEVEKTSDSDLALASAKSKFESRQEYAERLRNYLNQTKDVK